MQESPPLTRSWLHRYGAAIGLAAVVLASTGLATRWVFLVPIFHAPDEQAHLDYALCLYQQGGLLVTGNTPLTEEDFGGLDFGLPQNEQRRYEVHPWSQYLRAKGELDAVRFNPDARISSDYGTRSFFAELDAGAPPLEKISIDKFPALMRSYPFGYYALAAVWIAGVRMFTDSLTITFFATRMLSVVLLGLNLVVIYHTLRELRGNVARSLAITACVGCFPLVTFVGSYIQPDNLAFFLVSVSLYLSLVARRTHGSLSSICLLGLSLGALLVTKTHFCFCVAAPIVATLLVELFVKSEFRRHRVAKFVLLATPSVVLGAIHFYTVQGVTNFFAASTARPTLNILGARLRKALSDYYIDMSHQSFWGLFGWLDTPLVIGSHRVNWLIWATIQAVGMALLLLTLVRLEQVASRLALLVRRGRSVLALRLALSNPVLNSYFAFTVFMVVLYVWLDNRFGAQGRHWIPFMLPFVLTGIVYAPKALSLRPAQRWCSSAVLAGLLLFAALAGYYGPRSLRERYYPPWRGELASVPIQPELVAANEIVLQGTIAQASGSDPYLIFKMPPRFVHAVRLRFVLTQTGAPADELQTYWMKSSENTFSETQRTRRFTVHKQEGEHTLTLWINDTIDHLRIDPAHRPCRFEIRECSLLEPPHAVAARR